MGGAGDDANCTPKLQNLGGLNKDYAARGWLRKLLRGQSLQFNLTPPRVPMDSIGVEVRLEGLEVGPCPATEELVFQVVEHLPGGAVVGAV